MSKVSLVIGIIICVVLLALVMSVVTKTFTAAEAACNTSLDGDGWVPENMTASEENKTVHVTCTKDNRTENITMQPPEADWVP